MPVQPANTFPPIVGIAILLAVMAGGFAIRAAVSRPTSDEDPRPAIESLIGDARQIYWEDPSNKFLWLVLGRPAYYTCLQGSGLLFNEGTALEYQRRSAVLARLNTVDFADDGNGICSEKDKPKQTAPSSISVIASVCKDLPDLDLIVLASKTPDWSPPMWRAPAVQHRRGKDGRDETFDRYYFYDCRTLRSGYG